jgi:uncharacterized protein
VNFRGIGIFLIGLAAGSAGAVEVMPPAPPAHFNDYAAIVRPATAAALDAKLAQFERDTSSQIVVVIYPRMQSDSSVDDYTVRVAQSWHVGLKGKDNGAVLFIFAQSHQMYLQVGYGLEGAVPDAIARRIIADEITPFFRRGDFDGGVTAGVNALLAATRGEYHGTGRTVADGRAQGSSLVFLFIIAGIIVLIIVGRSRASVYHNGGRGGVGGFMPVIFPGGGFGGGGGGGFSGGGGGFSGGGGSFGGGGAGGSW